MSTRQSLLRYYRIDLPDGTQAYHRASTDFVRAAVVEHLGRWQVLGHYSRVDLAEERIREWHRADGGINREDAAAVLPMIETEKPARKRVTIRLPNRREISHYYVPEWGQPRPVRVVVEGVQSLQPIATWLMERGPAPQLGPGVLCYDIPAEKV